MENQKKLTYHLRIPKRETVQTLELSDNFPEILVTDNSSVKPMEIGRGRIGNLDSRLSQGIFENAMIQQSLSSSFDGRNEADSLSKKNPSEKDKQIFDEHSQ